MHPEDLPDMIVGELMERWPASVPVLLGRRMACPGCLMARFMTVQEAALEHGVAPEDLIEELVRALAPAGSASSGGAAGTGPQELRS